jgi:molybdopterin synthase sulfur carrier subunit
MQVRVKLFATLGRHLTSGLPGIPFAVELPDGSTVETLVDQLQLPREEVKLVFVNGRARPMDWVLQPGDELGVFPPIGGG